MPVLRNITLVLCFLVAGAAISVPTRAADAPSGPRGIVDEVTGDLSPKAVQQGIDGAVAYLKEKQKRDGTWDEYPGFSPGSTALCALALLSVGLDANDPAVAKALDALRKPLPNSMYQTYPISLQTMVFCLAEPERDRMQIQRNVDWLVSRQFKTTNVFNGGWSYRGLEGAQQAYDLVDNSNSQFAVLALFEAQRIGIKIPDEVWSAALKYWMRMQNSDGSWGYRASPRGLQENASGAGTGSMTCAGLGALVICAGAQARRAADVQGDTVECCREVGDEVGKSIDRGLKWLARYFSTSSNPGSGSWTLYYLYGLERVGRLTAHRFIGPNDWYREGTDTLLRQKGVFTKYWRAPVYLNGNHCVATAFALLFLSKGRRPVLVSKLKYGDDGSWSVHRNDLLHLTEYTEKQWKLPLIWQMIDADKATVDDLLQTPVLYLCGTRTPEPSDAAKKRRLVLALRGYLEQGGFVFAEALDGDESFESGFRALIREVLPDEGDALALVPADHPIWHAEKTIPTEQLRPIYGIDFGCRTSVVFVPSLRPKTKSELTTVVEDRPSLSCLWELATQYGPSPRYAESVQKQIDAGLDIGVNILAYATNREMKYKEEMPESLAKELEKEGDRREAVHVALLEHSGGCSCAPRAIPRLLTTLRKETGIEFDPVVPRVAPGSKELFTHPVLYMHGRNTFHFPDGERGNMRLYLERGGFLFANAICASSAFQKAFEEEMRALLPDEPMVDIPADDPIYGDRYGGFAIKELELRQSIRREGRKIESGVSSAPPRLRGVKRNGRWIVVYSPYDISCALENSGSVECSGYTRESAFKLATNVLLYALEHL